MNQISEQEFRDAIIAIKKDTKLVAAAKNDRMSSMETLYREFEKLTVERRREIIITICNDFFTAAQWKIAFPLNNFPVAILSDAVQIAGKVLFYTREEDCIRECVRAMRLYQESPFIKRVAAVLSEGAETVGVKMGAAAQALTDPEVFGLVTALDPATASSETIVLAVGRVATYTGDACATADVARFLAARRYSGAITELSRLVEEAVFMARDRRCVRQMLDGLTAGAVDIVLQRKGQDRSTVAAIRDVAWRSRNWRIIRDRLHSL